jgi:hypothetical protein
MPYCDERSLPRAASTLIRAQSYGRPRRGIFTSEVATIRLPPKSISSVRPQPSISISVAHTPLSERSDEKIMTAGIQVMGAVDSNARLARHTRMTTPLLVDLALSDWPNPTWTCDISRSKSSRPIAATAGAVDRDRTTCCPSASAGAPVEAAAGLGDVQVGRRDRRGRRSRSFVSRLLRLTLLAPDIVETILEGKPAEGGAAGRSDASDVERMGGAETALLNRPPPHELRAEWVMSDH